VLTPGGAGDRAGLRAGDVITTLDGEKLKNPVKLARAIYARGSKATCALGVTQGGSTRTVSLTVPWRAAVVVRRRDRLVPEADSAPGPGP
jgi:S1-C subfamily serine protease